MYRRFFKRLIDFLLSLLGTILLSPVLAALAASYLLAAGLSLREFV